MNIVTYKGRVFTLIELTWLPILVPCLGLGIAAAFTPQDPPVPFVGWAILVAAILGMHLIALLYFVRKAEMQKRLRFMLTPPGLVVGWKEDKYCVSGEAVAKEVLECVTKMRVKFSNAENALRGCIVFFTDPVFIQPPARPGMVARRVAGVQDGQLLIIGWREDLSTSALKHELAHRILQVYDGDPPEVVAHAKMADLGVL
jgi:hypothetical protein